MSTSRVLTRSLTEASLTVPDLSKGAHALRINALLLALLVMTGCASSLARPETPRAREDAQRERAHAATTLAMDTDGDAIPDRVDTCPEAAEDIDTFQDADGCPDLDHDADGILDDVDSCPSTPEDVDGFEDRDGCPDLDNDKDGIKRVVSLNDLQFIHMGASRAPEFVPRHFARHQTAGSGALSASEIIAI